MARIISYVDIIEIMTDIARRHYQVNTFFLGKNYELGNSGDITYPVLQVYPEFARMPINDYKEYKTLEFTLNCKVIDLTTNDDGNLKDVYSDTLRIAQDIVNELNQHPFYVHSNVSLISDIQFNELDQFEDDITAGWGFSLNLRIINANTFCGMPIAELPGYSATGPTSDGVIVNVKNLTCETLEDCPTITTIEDTLNDLQDQIDGLATKGSGTILGTLPVISGQIPYSSGVLDTLTSSTKFTVVNDSVTFTENLNTPVLYTVKNNNGGIFGAAGFNAINNLGKIGQFYKTGSGYITYKTLKANDAGFYTDSGDIIVLNDNVTGNIQFTAGGASVSQLKIDSTYSTFNNKILGKGIVAQLEPSIPMEMLGGILVRDSGGANARISGLYISSTEAAFTATYYGGSTYVPLSFYSSDLLRFQIKVNGNITHSKNTYFGNTAIDPTSYVEINGSSTTNSSMRIRAGSTLPTFQLDGEINYVSGRLHHYTGIDNTIAYLSDVGLSELAVRRTSALMTI